MEPGHIGSECLYAKIKPKTVFGTSHCFLNALNECQSMKNKYMQCVPLSIGSGIMSRLTLSKSSVCTTNMNRISCISSLITFAIYRLYADYMRNRRTQTTLSALISQHGRYRIVQRVQWRRPDRCSDRTALSDHGDCVSSHRVTMTCLDRTGGVVATPAHGGVGTRSRWRLQAVPDLVVTSYCRASHGASTTRRTRHELHPVPLVHNGRAEAVRLSAWVTATSTRQSHVT